MRFLGIYQKQGLSVYSRALRKQLGMWTCRLDVESG